MYTVKFVIALSVYLACLKDVPECVSEILASRTTDDLHTPYAP